MSCILKYFRFLCQLKGHKASNKLVTKDFNIKFGYENGFLENSEALCTCPCSFNFNFLNSKLSSEKIKQLFINFHTFDFRLRYLPKYIDMGDFPPNDFFWGVQRLFTKYQLHKLNVNGKKAVSSKDSLTIFGFTIR